MLFIHQYITYKPSSNPHATAATSTDLTPQRYFLKHINANSVFEEVIISYCHTAEVDMSSVQGKSTADTISGKHSCILGTIYLLSLTLNDFFFPVSDIK